MNMNNWMARLDSKQSITRVSIPGTHESGAMQEGPCSKCQDRSIKDQLELGIRFLDIRLADDDLNKPLRVTHGTDDQKLTFSSVLSQVYEFLDKNKTEFVLMNVQMFREHSEGYFSRKFDEEVGRHEDKWFFGPKIPKNISEVRGRIVLIRADGGDQGWSSNRGLAWEGHDIDGESGFDIDAKGSFSTQNRWYVSREAKKTWIIQNIDKIPVLADKRDKEKLKETRDSEKILINFLSFVSPGSIAIHYGALAINRAIFEKIKGKPKNHCLGVMPMDFAGNTAGFIEEIIKHNTLDGMRIRDEPTGAVYLVLDGVLRHIPDVPTYENLFIDWDNITHCSDLDGYTIGEPLSKEVSLAKGTLDGKVFLLLKEEKRWISSPDVFEWYGFSLLKIQSLPADKLEAIPTGIALY